MSTVGYIFLIATATVISAYIVIIVLITAGWFRKRRKPAKTNAEPPFVSIITAVRDESDTITACLDALALQDYPANKFEIIIIDDASSDSTMEVVTRYIQVHPEIKIRLYSLQEEIPGAALKKAALACGLSKARGPVIAVTDADCVAGTGWLSALTGAFNDDRIMMAFGMVFFRNEKKWFSELQSLEFMSLVGAGAGAALAGHPIMCNGASMAFRKEVLDRTDAWNASSGYASGDDVFLLHHVKKVFGPSSIACIRESGSLVQTAPQPNVAAFIQQRVRWASKARGYRDIFSSLVSLVVFFNAVFLLATGVAGIFHPHCLYITGGLFVMKLMVDFPLMAGVSGYFKQSFLLRSYLPMQVFYPFYIIITAIGGLFGKYQWKGRRL